MKDQEIYARAFGIEPREVTAHRAEQLAALLFGGATISQDGPKLLAQLPGSRSRLGLRAALNRAKRTGLLRGRLRGAELPAVEITTSRGEQLLVVWCVVCQGLHTHGRDLGARVPHCDRNGREVYGGCYRLVPACETALVSIHKAGREGARISQAAVYEEPLTAAEHAAIGRLRAGLRAGVPVRAAVCEAFAVAGAP